MKMVWPTVWPGAAIACTPGRNSWPSLKNTMPIPHRQQVLAGVHDEVLQRTAHLAFIGPEIEVALRDVVLRIGEQRLVVGVDDAADMVDMGVRQHDGVDILRLDAGFLHALLLPPGGRPERL